VVTVSSYGDTKPPGLCLL